MNLATGSVHNLGAESSASFMPSRFSEPTPAVQVMCQAYTTCMHHRAQQTPSHALLMLPIYAAPPARRVGIR